MRRPWLPWIPLLLVAACGGGAGTPDAGSGRDTGTSSDAPAVGDADAALDARDGSAAESAASGDAEDSASVADAPAESGAVADALDSAADALDASSVIDGQRDGSDSFEGLDGAGDLVAAADADDAAIPHGPMPDSPGVVVITEFMPTPSALTDAQGEWFELVNKSSQGKAWDLLGCVIRDETGEHHTISRSLVMPVGGVVTMARSSAPGFTPDYVYDSFTLDGAKDQIILECGGMQIDRVAYDGTFPLAAGRSTAAWWVVDSISNDAGSAWCLGVDVYGAGDRGTPGTPNKPCPM
jgi:hypothetical protein